MGKTRRVLQKGVTALVSLYQYFISPLTGPCCRFSPSCSEYAKEAITQHGCIKGGVLSVLRLLRCQPLMLKWWQSSGYDPVPTLSTSKQTAEQHSTEQVRDNAAR